MSDRIRLLEDALTILQSTVSSESHPLLDRDLLKIKSSIELHAAIQDAEGENLSKLEEADEQYIDAFGTLAIRDDGAATFYGRSAGSEVGWPDLTNHTRTNSVCFTEPPYRTFNIFPAVPSFLHVAN